VAAWNTSKYDQLTNRCYGRFYQHITKQDFSDKETDQLFDLQTNDLFADATSENGNKYGSIWDPDYKKPWLPLCHLVGCPPDFGDQTWQAAEDYMDEMMVDRRPDSSSK
jgi:hypothetical protein